MIDREHRRWAALVDREAIGEVLNAQEIAFCRDYEQRNSDCHEELEVWQGLERWADDGLVCGESQALVERVLSVADTKPADRQTLDVEESPRRWSRRALGLGALALAAAAAIVLAIMSNPKQQTPASRAELVYVSGDVSVDGHPAVLGGDPLTEGDRIALGDARACIAIDPGIDVCMGPHSVVQIGALASADRRVDLLAGRAVARLAPQHEGTSFSIATGDVSVRAVGTIFAVEAPSDDDAVVATVLEGVVDLATPHETRPLRTHERAQVGSAGVHVSPASRTEEAETRALLPERSPWHEGDVAVLVVETEPPGAHVIIDQQPAGPAPVSLLVGVGSHAVTATHDGFTEAARETTVQPGDPTVLELTLELDAPEPPAVVAPPAPPTSAEPDKPPARARPDPPATILAQARQHLKAGRHREAARSYRQLVRAHPKSPEAHTVLVPLADLLLDHLDNPRAAARAYGRYLEQGGGPLAHEARLGKIRALRRIGANDKEQAAIEQYLNHHPRSYEAKQLRKRLQTLRGTP